MADEDVTMNGMTLVEICRICTVETEFVVELVNEGVLEPGAGAPEEWRFTGAEIRRITLATRLSHDLGLNPAGVALALELLEEIRRLRVRLEAR